MNEDNTPQKQSLFEKLKALLKKKNNAIGVSDSCETKLIKKNESPSPTPPLEGGGNKNPSPLAGEGRERGINKKEKEDEKDSK